MNKNTVVAVLFAYAPLAAFADCRVVGADAKPHTVCTADSPPPTNGLDSATGLAEAVKLRQQQELIDLKKQLLELQEQHAGRAAASPGRMASDTELHAMYCLAYLKGTVDPAMSDLTDLATLKAQHAQLVSRVKEAQQSNADNLQVLAANLHLNETFLSVAPEKLEQMHRSAQEAIDAVNKLSLYLQPRLPELSAGGVTAMQSALASGQVDAGAEHQEAEDLGRTPGLTNASPEVQAYAQKARARLQSCVPPSYLPY